MRANPTPLSVLAARKDVFYQDPIFLFAERPLPAPAAMSCSAKKHKRFFDKLSETPLSQIIRQIISFYKKSGIWISSKCLYNVGCGDGI